MMVMVGACGELLSHLNGQSISKSERSSRKLEEIDSLMWQQPDSALVLMMAFVVSPKADSLNEFDGHYCQLLISELLYKNYKRQSNRTDLLRAVDFFDHTDNTFLDARAHYINGAGLYEQGDVVNACSEYLKALEIMDKQFDEKDLTGKKIVFLFYTYNRLLELFSAQFMMDPAIACGEKALAYCQKEPSLSNKIPKIYFYIGKQYDKKGQNAEARQYFINAIEKITSTDNLFYRDVTSAKALCDYQLDHGFEQSIIVLRNNLNNASSEMERLTRFLTIGDVFYEEGLLDSALAYLEPVYFHTENSLAKVKSGEYLYVIYDSIGEKDKSDECMRFLAEYKKSEGEAKAMVSLLENLYQDYQNQMREKQVEISRQASIRKTIGIIIPISIIITLAIAVLAKSKSKLLLKKHQEEANRVLGETKQKHEEDFEAERLIHQKEQESLRRNLQYREKQLNAMEKALEQQSNEVEQRRMAFLNEPICQHILNLLHGKHITARDTSYQHGISLGEADYKQLKEAVERHYEGFDNVLLSRCSDLELGDLRLCHLYLLGLDNPVIAALNERIYSTIRKRENILKKKLGAEESMAAYVQKAAERLCGTQNGTQTIESVKYDIDVWILNQIKENPKITTEELAEKSHKGVRTIKRHIAMMEHIRFVGSGYSGHWELLE